MLKIDFLKKLGLAAIVAPLIAQQPARAQAAGDADQLEGLWEGVVIGDQPYHYIWSISRGAYVATGDVDENFMNFKFSPTMGTSIRNGDGTYKFRERGYVFDVRGKNVGTFTSTGSLRISADGSHFSGQGAFTQYDLRSKQVAKEPFTIRATRVSV